jgi:hypothetical protein
MTDAQAIHRPYFFEIFTIVNLLIIHGVLVRYYDMSGAISSLPQVLFAAVPTAIAQLLVGVLIRAAVLRYRGKEQMLAYLRVVRSKRWIVDSLRLSFFIALTVHTYAWIKLTIPVIHPHLYDQQLWDLDRAIFFGFSPTIFFLSLFSNGVALRVVDFTYAYVFVGSINLAFLFFLSSPSRRIRVAFNNGNTLMWITGSWLYMLVPSLGPAYRFPQVWFEYSQYLAHTHFLQAMLMRNYQLVVHPVTSAGKPINVVFGIAAFPSLHVGFLTFVFLWMRRLWRHGGIVFGVATLFIFLGSVVTGWHYLIDAIAGMVLAIICYLIFSRTHRMNRALHLSEIVRRA